jgi:2-polyprenyl-3-methyl-5-hydroxy-6-metoxy-1,4-benzoquinol methylase
MNVVPRGTHDWNKFITLDEMTSILDKSMRPNKVNIIVIMVAKIL